MRAYNDAMTPTVIDYREAIDHLPPDGTLVLQKVSWEDYETLLEDLVDRPGVLLSYDEGRLQIVTTSSEHEEYKESLFRMLCVYAEARKIEIETRGQTTWKRKKLLKGSEADTCFYVANLKGIIG